MLGGLLAGAFEGFAKGGLDIADDQIKANALEAKSLKDNAENDRRVRYAMQIKLEQEQVEATRDAMSQERAEGRADTTGNDRRFTKFKQDLGQTDLNDSQIRQVFDEYYNQKAVEGGGAQANRYVESGSTREKDVLDSLIKEGGSGNLIKGQRDLYKNTLSAEAKAKDDARRERDQVRKEDRDAARDQLDRDRLLQQDKNYNRRLDIMENRPAGGSGGRSNDPEKNAITRAREERLSLKDDRATVIKALDARLINKDEAKRRMNDIDARDTRLKKIEDGESPAEKPAPVKQDAGKSKPQSTLGSLPSGAKQIGTSGGKPVYQTPDGKKFIGE